MKINKEQNKIILNYEELHKAFVNHNMEKIIKRRASEEYEYHWENDYCEECIILAAVDYANEDYDFIEDIDLNGAYFDSYGYAGSEMWLCNSDNIKINDMSKDEWLDEPLINREEVKEMFEEVERCLCEAIFDYYDIEEYLLYDYKHHELFTISLSEMELLNENWNTIMEFEIDDLSEDIKKLIKPVEKTYTYTKVEYELLGGR